MQKGAHFGSLVGSRGFSKKPMAKIWDFALKKKGRVKRGMAKRAPKSVTKKRGLTFNFKHFKYEYLTL